MAGPQRKPDQTAISVSMPKALLADIDARCSRLGLKRSEYLASLARNDLVAGRELVLRELHSVAPETSSAPAHPMATEVVESALSKYPKRKRPAPKASETPK